MGGMGVGDGGGATVAGTVGVVVAGTGVGVEPEQAATKAATVAKKRAKNRIEDHRRPKSFVTRLKMLTSVLRTAAYLWMYPLAQPIKPLCGQSRVYHWASQAERTTAVV